MSKQMPLITIDPRGAVTSEGKVIFRYPKVANIIAEEWAAQGVTCKVKEHNWGAAVEGKISKQLIQSAFNA